MYRNEDGEMTYFGICGSANLLWQTRQGGEVDDDDDDDSSCVSP